ncbi:C4-dicarboxylic acid transporter DauA [Saccharophagus degradans]|uniref:C4-dicarboxylic acid transporter DauA n=1 Tax=Saccharophagus degradans TaxID=86304 RepID=UPI001C0A3B6A|nr:C4-dicarboxylic acid transporter DauA [Saccharophagus degradans]MBU2984119.1 C4-dicarboxylic acid transporter DauA [Saccharophagus degradans]
MPHRAHLSSLQIANAIRESISEGYTKAKLTKDIMAGCAVGIIAIPLAMALAIASGVAPQYGLYTAIIAGFLIALSGGSRFSISGPTAAFVVILHPLAMEHGLGGLLIASIMAGILLIFMAYARLGRFIEYIPHSVTLGFTGGIGIVIAILQIPDFLGIAISSIPEHVSEKVSVIIANIGSTNASAFSVAIFTLTVMVAWPRLKTPIPAHLPAVILASVVTFILNQNGFDIATIGSRFHYTLDNGSSGYGIPPVMPYFEWPWLRETANGERFILSWATLVSLAPAAFAIAMLAAIESLLCAVVLDGMSGKRHSANSELLGQGIGNIVAPFFGGITATAAIARSAASFKAGAQSPIAAMVHACVVLIAVMALASLLKFLPMPALAAMLMVVAWNMSEAHKSLHLIRTGPPRDIAVFITCISLTVWFDMVIAITTGILLSSILFMQEIARMTKLTDITNNSKFVSKPINKNWKVLRVNGPLFFAAADRVFGEINEELKHCDGIVLYLEATPILDAGGLTALSRLITEHEKTGKSIFFAEWQFQPLKTLAKAKIKPTTESIRFFSCLEDALKNIVKT